MPLSLGGSPTTRLRCMVLLSADFLGGWHRHWARRAIRCMLSVAVGTLDGTCTGVVCCPMDWISAEPAPQRIFTPLCPVQSPAPPTLMRSHPSGDWVFNFQTSAHEHNRPGGVFQSFCPEGQPDRRCQAPFSYIGPARSFWGHAEGTSYVWEDVLLNYHVPGTQVVIVI
jgi:hypothetical protein